MKKKHPQHKAHTLHAKDNSKHFLARSQDFVEQHKAYFTYGLLVLLILIPLFLAIFFRSFPANLAVTEKWAENSVRSSIRSSLTAQVQQQYPNLPTTNRDQLVDEQFQKVLAEQGDQIDLQIEAAAASFKAQLQDQDGQTYLVAIDPYQYLRYVEDIEERGHVGDEMRDGRPYDKHMRAPIGRPTNGNLHTKLSYYIHRFLSLFGKRSILSSVFWVPLIFASLAVIPAFFLGRRKAGLLGGFFVAMLIAVHSGFIGRTAAGFADTDPYVVLFPLITGLFLLEAFETKWGDWKRHVLFLGLTGFSFGLLALIWEWWYFFDVFALAVLAYCGFLFIRHLVLGKSLRAFVQDDRFKSWTVTFFGFIVVVAFFISIFQSFDAFLLGPLKAISQTSGIKSAVNIGNIWPNVFTTVAELNAPSIGAIINSIGGKMLFILSLMGVLATMVSSKRLLLKDWILLGFGFLTFLFLVGKGASFTIIQFLLIMILPVILGLLLLLKDERDIDVKYSLFLIAWLAASVFTMTKGVRFILLLIPPFAIGAGIAVGSAYTLFRDWLTKEVKFSSLWVAPTLFIVLSLLLLPAVVDGYNTGVNEAPSMSDAWWDSLTKIKEESQPDAIINSWWDFGHWFKYVADRAVTFDGASQNTPMAHWIGRVLVTDDEKEALGILRMLDCGSQLGVEDIYAGLKSQDHYEAVTLMKEIILLSPADARERLLAAGIDAAQTETILNHTHCVPPEDYFITSADMVGKGGVWGHFGSWDFAKADAYANMRKLTQAEAVPKMAAKYGWTEEQAGKVYYEMQTLPSQTEVNTWISPWPGYPMNSPTSCQYAKNGTLMLCPLNVRVSQQQNTNGVLEGLIVNLSDVNKSSLQLGFYDSSGRKVGQNNDVRPATIILLDGNESTTYQLADSSFNQAFTIDVSGSPKALMLDPLNAEALFTRLFFFEGAGTTAFEKFSDKNAFNMGRIIVWKVDWSKLEEFDLV